MSRNIELNRPVDLSGDHGLRHSSVSALGDQNGDFMVLYFQLKTLMKNLWVSLLNCRFCGNCPFYKLRLMLFRKCFFFLFVLAERVLIFFSVYSSWAHTCRQIWLGLRLLRCCAKECSESKELIKRNLRRKFDRAVMILFTDDQRLKIE